MLLELEGRKREISRDVPPENRITAGKFGIPLTEIAINQTFQLFALAAYNANWQGGLHSCGI